MFSASLLLLIYEQQDAHTCKIAEGDPIAQEVMFVFYVGRLVSGAF